MEESDKKLTRKISPYKIIYPVIIGLGVVSYMLYREFDLTAFEQISFGWSSVFWLSVAVMCMFIRDLVRYPYPGSFGGSFELDQVDPDYFSLGIYLGGNSLSDRRYQSRYSFCQ